MSARATDIALDFPRMRHMSAGMTAYADELVKRLPRVAPDLRFETFERGCVHDFAEQVVFPLRLRRARPRLVHHLAVYAPLFAPRPTVITIHDLIHLRFPTLFKNRVRPYYATVVRGACARAARVITDDERTIADLERFLGVPPSKVSVVPLGVDERYLAPVHAADEPRPYFLYVGNHRAHKDLPTLFSAWESLDLTCDVDLLVTGGDDFDAHTIRPRRLRGELRYLGDVHPVRLAALYRGALALVQPALCEGFGLPLLEAAAVGTALIACEDAVPAVLRPYAAVFPPRDVRTLVTLMSDALLHPARRDDAARFARTLTWDRCAERTADVYRNVLEGSSVR